jgi:hypothetical protein
LVINLFGASFHLVQSRKSHFQMGGLNDLQKACDHSLIHTISPHGLASSRGELRMELVTFVHQQGAIALIANAHASATRAAQDDALQERRPLSNRSSVLLSTPGAVIVELPLVVQKVFPRAVARVSIQQHNGPVFLRETARSPFDAGFFARKRVSSELGTPIDVGPRVQGAVQDVQHPLMRETTPEQFICPLASPPTRREAQVRLRKGTDDGEGRVPLLKQREDQANGFGNGRIRVEHHPAHWIGSPAPMGKRKRKLPCSAFVIFPPCKRWRSQWSSASDMLPLNPSNKRSLCAPGS